MRDNKSTSLGHQSPMANENKLLYHPLSLGLLALLCALAMTSAWNQRNCSFVSVATGMLRTSEPFAIVPDVRGYLHCADACLRSLGLGCLSLSYSKEQRQCRMYSVFDPGDVTVASPSYKYYRGCPGLDIKGTSCGVDADCSADNFECRDGTCQCVIGYHFYPGPGTCVATCPSGYGDDYYTVFGWCVLQNNAFVDDSGLTLEECLQLCRSDPLCRSFEHHVDNGRCHVSHVTKLQREEDWGECTKMPYRQLDCA